jgi:hypothetical protein
MVTGKREPQDASVMFLRKKEHRGRRGGNAEAESRDVIEAFEKEIARQEEILYGIALFFEGISLLHGGREEKIETYGKQLRNAIQSGRAATDEALDLLARAREDPSSVALIRAFEFKPGEGYPDPEGLTRRAEVLARKYNELFPDRPRTQPFAREEIRKLLDAAAEEMGAPDP